LLQILADIGSGAEVTVSITDKQRTSDLRTTISLEQCQTIAMSALCAAGHTFEGFEAWTTYPPLWMNGRFDVVGDEPSRYS
jgi:uncharacterized membrane protein